MECGTRWGLCGLKQTHFMNEENLYIGAVVFHIPTARL